MRLIELKEPRITKALKTSVAKWAKNNLVYPLHSSLIQELLSLPVRPTAPVKLYRGLLFSDERGAKFKEAIETKTLTFPMEWSRPSSWTTEQYVADGFARNANIGDDNVMGQIFNRDRWKDSEIDGELGVVLQVTASPEQIICGLDYLGLESEFGHEHEFILKADRLMVTIVNAFDRSGSISL